MARRKRLTPIPEGGEGFAADPGAARTTVGTARAPIAAVTAEATAEAALAELADALQSARSEGRLAQAIPLEAVEVAHLARDRLSPEERGGAASGVDEEMDALVESLRIRGQQTPIEVVELGQGRYGLISGWRRLTALRRLAASGRGAGSAVPGTVLAVLRRPAGAAEAYVAMVEENEIRVGLSFWERARIVTQAVARGAYPDTGSALRGLFASASRAKRSKIGSFLLVVEALEGALAFPTALPERLGLRLAARLKADPDAGPEIAAALLAAQPETPEAERLALEDALAAQETVSVARDDVAEPPHEPVARAPRKPRISSGAEGIVYMSVEPGGIVLTGPGVTKSFQQDLIRWLDGR